VRVEAATMFGTFLKPNRKADAALTAAARASDAAHVTPVQAHYRVGQAIVRVGDVIRPDTLAALHASGLLDRNTSWQTLLGDFALAALAAALLHGYLIAS